MAKNPTTSNQARDGVDQPAMSGLVPPGCDPLETPELLAEDPLLQALLRSISSPSGPDGFRVLVQSLAAVLQVKYAVVAEFLPESQSARSLAFWAGDRFLDAVEWKLESTPCKNVLGGQFSHHPSGLQRLFPNDMPLMEMGAESYLGVPLLTHDQSVLGHLFVIDTKPMPQEPRNLAIFRVFAARAASELVRLRLERTLAQSEERFKDLFDEAPIAYVHEGLDSRFIRANKTAIRILGIRPEDVPATFGKTFVADTPETQRRLREAFESIGRGTDTSGVVLEMRRKDNGKPFWIQWWSRPDASGAYTRTMFLDITEKVLLEREQARLTAQNLQLRDDLKSAHNFGEIVGNSPGLIKVLEKVDRVAPTDSTVLIQGETGTGKELVARAIHERSQRKAAPFVKVNCAALPAGLVESEFFGHEKGAFTGAVSSRRGRFELADGGTIFLDEVGEVAPDVQVKLLRVLQENEFERVGGTHTIKVSVRVIAATNRDLEADVASGKFRADLFYRLSVFPVLVPPLRERVDDIPALATFFVTQLAAGVGKRFDAIDPESMDSLLRYRWAGNIRELRNVLERAVILCDGPVLRIDERSLTTTEPVNPAPSRTLADLERDHIVAVLKQTNGAIAGPKGAAKVLGIPPSTLRSTLERLGIKPK
jgi:formate hydrogenlyase transcriptional activator